MINLSTRAPVGTGSDVLIAGLNLGGTDQDELRGAAVFAGAFPLAEGSKDIATIVTLGPVNYTIVVRGQNGAGGVALMETYDLL